METHLFWGQKVKVMSCNKCVIVYRQHNIATRCIHKPRWFSPTAMSFFPAPLPGGRCRRRERLKQSKVFVQYFSVCSRRRLPLVTAWMQISRPQLKAGGTAATSTRFGRRFTSRKSSVNTSLRTGCENRRPAATTK